MNVIVGKGKCRVFGLMLVLIGLFVCLIISTPNQAAAVENPSPASAVLVAPFPDVSSSDGNALYVKYLVNKGIISGYSDGNFHPGEGLTRAQAAVIMAKVAGLTVDPTLQSAFKDVSAAHWAKSYINAVAKAGYIKGMPDGSFLPEEKLTRAQGISLLLRLSKQDQSLATLPSLTDINSTHWAAKSVAVGIASGMVGLSPDGKQFLPDAPFTRIALAHALGLLLTEDPDLNSSNLPGTIKPVSGTIIIRKSSGQEQKITKETLVNIGDIIISGSNSSCELIYPDGSSLLIKEKTELSIKEARGRKYIKSDGNENIAVDWLNLDIKEGTILTALATKHEVQKDEENRTLNTGKLHYKDDYLVASLGDLNLADAKSNPEWWKVSKAKKVKVKVDMPWGVASVRGTFIIINVSPGGQASVNCLTGDAEVSNYGVTVPLSQGQSTAVSAPSAAPAPTSSLTAVAIQQFVQEQNWIQETAQIMDQEQEAAPPPAPQATTIYQETPTGSVTPATLDTPATPSTSTSQTQSALETVNQALQETTGEAPSNTNAPSNPTNPATTPSTPSGGGGAVSDDSSGTIQSVSDLMDTVVEGDPYQLPTVVTATMSNGTTKQVPVNWNTDNPDTSIVGVVTINGTVPGYANPVRLILAVGRRFGTPAPITAGQPIVIQGGITVDLGAMSIPEGATVTVQEVASPDLGTTGIQAAGKVVDINFSNIAINQPVEISLPLNPGIDPNKSAIYLYDNGEWEYQPSQFRNGSIVATVNHFSIYGVLMDQNPPENVSVSKGDVSSGNVELLLSAQDSSGEIKYQIYRNGELLATTTDSHYVDQGLERGNEYNYQIKAMDRFGNISEFSPELVVIVVGNNANLSGLSISPGAIESVFEKDTLNYNASVSCEVESVSITATPADNKAVLTINGSLVNEENASIIIDLEKGENIITIVVKAEDETTIKTYTLVITRARNNYTDLSLLSIRPGTIEPVFDKDTLNYTAGVAGEVGNIGIAATAADENASVSISGTPVVSSDPININLGKGENVILILVKAEDETTTKTYTLVVTRALDNNADLAGLTISSGMVNPAFDKDIVSYISEAGKEVEQVTLGLTPAALTASIKVNGADIDEAASIPLTLNPGENIIVIEVIAEDGTTAKSYTLTVNRSLKNNNAYLSSLSTSAGGYSPGFNKEQAAYSCTVPYYVGSISMNAIPEDSLATVSINGSLGTSSTVTLNEGANTVIIRVTAEDGNTTMDYSLTVTRDAAPPPPPLSSACEVIAVVSPTGTNVTGTEITATVGNITENVNVSVAVSDYASWRLYADSACSQEIADKIITLNVGVNVAYIEVTAQNGNVKIYSLSISRNQEAITSAQISGAVKLSDFADVEDAHAGITITIKGTLEGGAIEFSTTTSSDGSYSFANLPACNFVLEAGKSGYCSTNILVQTTDNQTTVNETIMLIPEIITGSVEGYAKFIDKTDYQGIGIQIQTLEGKILPNLIAMTDSNGYFKFDNVPVSGGSTTYIFTAFALDDSLNYGTDSVEVTVQANELTTLPNILWLRPAAIDLIIFADDPTAWDYDDNFRPQTPLYDMLQESGDHYTIYPSSEMSTLDLPVNKTVWVINDQPQGFYDSYKTNQERFDDFVNRGGTLLFEACDSGWNGGSLSAAGATLPGGVVNAPCYDRSNTNINPTHPMMSGVPINLTGDYASHNYFNNLPDIATVLCVDTQNHPTLVEYKFGQGRVVATGQTLEISYRLNWNLRQIYPNMIAYTFNKPTAAGLAEPFFTLSNGDETVEPIKSQNTITYTATVGADVTQLTVTPTAPQGTITVNGSAVANGTPSQSIALDSESTLIRIVVFENAKLPRTYTIAVTRAPVIETASIDGVAAPATGETPIAVDALSTEATSYTITSITWLNEDGTTPATLTDEEFSADSTYKARIVLTSAAGYKFPADGLTPTVNVGTPAAGIVDGGDVAGNTLTFIVGFPATGAN
ncbi:MAG: cadherin-like beta sandwich domain-containing protein [Syntrophomonas sp.]